MVHHSICFCAAILWRKCTYLSFLVIKVSHYHVCICPFGTVVILMLLHQSATSAHDLCFPSPTWCWLQFSLWPAPLPRWPSQNQHGASLHKISSAKIERAREINTMWAINISTIVFDSECSRGSSGGMCGVAAYLLQLKLCWKPFCDSTDKTREGEGPFPIPTRERGNSKFANTWWLHLLSWP